MRVYETTFIVNPQTDDATIDQQVIAVSDLIARHGGRILQEERMGTRRLAYPIRKLTQGYYHSFIFEAPQNMLPELDRYFRINEAYLRFLTLSYEGNVETLRSRAPEPTERREQPQPGAAAPAGGAVEGPEEVVVAQSIPAAAVGEDVEEAAEEESPEEEPEDESEEDSDEEYRGL